jgi:hypothetical protein
MRRTLAAALILAGLASHVLASNRDTAQPDAGPPSISARDGGARYGQAAGAALVCYGLRVTDRVDELRARYSGAELDEFDREARRIAEAWRATLLCEHAGGPNQCKLSHVWSCQQALKEIGPDGTAARGLVEPKK